MNGHTFSLPELEQLLPKLPERKAAAYTPNAPLSDDDNELIARLGQASLVFGRLYAGDTSDYVHQCAKHGCGAVCGRNGTVDNNEADWALTQDLMRGTGGAQERTYRLMRQSGLERSKWDEPRDGRDYLAYTIARAADAPSVAQNAAAERSGPSNGRGCSSDCPYRQREQALMHQVQLINKVLQLNLAAEIKVLLLWMTVLVGVNAGQKFNISADSTGKKLHLSGQFVRGFFHAACRYDLTKRHKVSPEVDPRSALNNERGLFDLDSTRAKDINANANEFARMFSITPLTGSDYVGFLEAALECAPELLPAPVKRTRRKLEEVKPPLPVAIIPTHGAGHAMHSDEVACAECGEEFVREIRYTPLARQNALPQRSEPGDHGSFSVGVSNATPQRFEVASADLERLARLYERAAS